MISGMGKVDLCMVYVWYIIRGGEGVGFYGAVGGDR